MEDMRRYEKPQMEIINIRRTEIVRTSDFNFDVSNPGSGLDWD